MIAPITALAGAMMLTRVSAGDDSYMVRANAHLAFAVLTPSNGIGR